jgi:hypothetical protein
VRVEQAEAPQRQVDESVAAGSTPSTIRLPPEPAGISQRSAATARTARSRWFSVAVVVCIVVLLLGPCPVTVEECTAACADIP